ncbi:MAG: type III-A CRISPR-associated RAMP protein Csm5 [Caldiserica bacterium]|jgi:CRISPR type III-A-associated RAMP protein Csm5|nr:type III-A CRISPR-associated RAMP protein Csm5 [Caldisericota bacterium]MDH7562835.1 type III-A CRISPR-associated RAMP protein Csm5 [Caldisericota bacterium]
MRLKIKVLSPIHIGSGEELPPMYYYIQEGKFLRLNFDSLFQDPEFRKYSDSFIKHSIQDRDIKGQVREIKEIIRDESLLKKHIMYAIPLGGGFEPGGERRRYPVKTFVKSAGRVFIPGSSLKGAILSAISWYWLSREGQEQHFRDNNSLLDFVIGNSTALGVKNKFSRWLDVSDSDLKDPSQVLCLSLAKSVNIRGRSSIPIFYETLKPGTEFQVEIKTSLPGTDYSWGRPVEEILKCVKDFYEKVRKKDDEFFKEMASSRGTIEVPDVLRPKDENSFLIRLGQGSTANSTSLLIAANERRICYKISKPPKHPSGEPVTRKLVGGSPMGWAVLTPVSGG